MSNLEKNNNTDATDDTLRNELIAMPEWTHSDQFRMPLGKLGVSELISVPGASGDPVPKPGDVANGSGARERVVIGELSEYKGGNPGNKIGFDGIVRK